MPFHPLQGQMPDGVQKLWEAQQQLQQARSDLDEVVSQRSKTPLTDRRELQRKDDEIKNLRRQIEILTGVIHKQEGEMSWQHNQLRDQNIMISQQAETIKIHSNELSRSEHRIAKFEPSPCRYPSQFNDPGLGQLNALVYGDNPPFYGPSHFPNGPPAHPYGGESSGQSRRPSQQAPLETKWGTINHGESANKPSRSSPRCNDPFQSPTPQSKQAPKDISSPLPIRQMQTLDIQGQAHTGQAAVATAARAQLVTLPPKQNQRRKAPEPPVTPPTSSGTAASNNGIPKAPPPSPVVPLRTDTALSKPRSVQDAVLPHGTGTWQGRMSNLFRELMDRAIDFAYRHVNFPSNQADSNIPLNLKNKLMTGATKTSAFRLMSNQKTRYFLVAKIIIQWLQEFVFHDTSFFGLNKTIDESIEAIRKKIYNNTPPIVRAVYHQDIARQFTLLRAVPNWGDFMNQKSHERAQQLYSTLKPLMNRKTDGDWEDLYFLVRHAHKVGELMVTDAAEYRLFFTKVNDKFVDAAMINMDEDYKHMIPDDIMAADGLVRLGAIPSIMCRVTDSQGQVGTRTLIKAGVLLKFDNQAR